MPKHQALLLIGPTGAGKTPLGDYVERHGFGGRRCFHFDFGAELRAAAARSMAAGAPDFARGSTSAAKSRPLTRDDDPNETDRTVIRRVIETGALLEDAEFPIALRVFRRFVRSKSVRPDDWIVLNGLPRHAGQALGMESEVEVRLVAVLHAPPSIVRERIRTDAAGDRMGRSDDNPAEIGAKLKIFEDWTRPLIEFYAARGAAVIFIDVAAATTAAAMAELLASAEPATEAPGARRALGLLSLAVFLASSTWFTGTAAGSYLKLLWGLGAGQTAWLTIAVQLGFIAGTFAYALFNLSDAYPVRRVFALSALAGAVFNAAFAWPGNGYSTALIFRFLTGASLAGVYPVGLKIVAQWHRVGLGRPLSKLIAALTLGSSMPFLIMALGGRVDPHALLSAASALALGGSALVGFGLEDGPYRLAPARFDWKAAGRAFANRAFRIQAWGYFGHMWELYAFWSLGVSYVGAALAGTPLAGGRPVALIAFLIFLAGVGGCLAGGALSRSHGEKIVALAALAISSGCCALSPLFFGGPAWVLIPFVLVWGAAVIADSPQFSGLAARACEPEYMGTALTIQNGIGFAVTVVSIQFTASAVPLLGWRWAFVLLLPGPLLGAWAAWRIPGPISGMRSKPV
jgi:adenylate kinase family enzyme/MFS family permease